MRDAVRTLFWLWCLTSTVILLIRTSNRRKGATATPVDGKLTRRDSLLGKSLAPTSPMADADRLLAGEVLPAPAAPAMPSVLAAMASAEPDDRGAPAVSPPRPAPSGVDRPPAATIAEALHGVDWPCELTPLIDLSAQHLADRQVTFWTTSAGPDDVRRQLNDALAAQGYAVEPPTGATFHARRPGTTVGVRLHAEAGRAEHDGAKLFASLPAHAVVVVFMLTPA